MGWVKGMTVSGWIMRVFGLDWGTTNVLQCWAQQFSKELHSVKFWINNLVNTQTRMFFLEKFEPKFLIKKFSVSNMNYCILPGNQFCSVLSEIPVKKLQTKSPIKFTSWVA